MIKTIAFDVFGTLVKIKQGRSPYRKMFKFLKNHGREYMSDDVISIMTLPFDFRQFSEHFKVSISNEILQELDYDLQCDLHEIELYEDSLSVLEKLQLLNFKVAICSNLAKPYGIEVQKKLPVLDAYVLSYEVGVIKPDPKIYFHLLQKTYSAAHEVLFIGDTPHADCINPHLKRTLTIKT